VHLGRRVTPKRTECQSFKDVGPDRRANGLFGPLVMIFACETAQHGPLQGEGDGGRVVEAGLAADRGALPRRISPLR